MERPIRDDDTAVYGDKGYARGARARRGDGGDVGVKEKPRPEAG